MRISRLKHLCCSRQSLTRFDIRPSVAYTIKSYHTIEFGVVHKFQQNGFRMKDLCSTTHSHSFRYSSQCRGSLFSAGNISPLGYNRLFSSASEAKSNIVQVTNSTADSGAIVNDVSHGGISGGDWTEKLKELWQSSVDAAKYTGEKAKEVSDGVTPHVQQLLDSYPYLRDVIVPIGGTLVGTLLAWSLLPSLLRRFHGYSMEGPAALLARSSLWGPVPYEKSFWGALEDPIRYFVTFLAFLQIGQMVAPDVIVSHYAAQAWKGAFVLSLVWFLHRWKTYVITRVLTAKNFEGVERDKLLTLDKVSSVGLLVVGSMALAEACGVAVQSILTVGGVGGVATAFAAKDILGNVLSGLSVQFSRPFSIGDTIKAGSVEGQVIEMGLTTTSLLTAEKFPVIVPNSLFSSQVIVNKSRGKWRPMVRKIPLRIDDIDKIPQLSEDIKSMLRSNSNVFLEKEAPYCFLSDLERSFAELTLGCNLNNTKKDAEQDILLQTVRIIKEHGAEIDKYAGRYY